MRIHLKQEMNYSYFQHSFLQTLCLFSSRMDRSSLNSHVKHSLAHSYSFGIPHGK